jgi:predicted RNase H-like nuclease (RuvC/YqgF family)
MTDAADTQTTPDASTHEPVITGAFDEERATRTIGNLRESEKALKEKIKELTPKAQELDSLKEAQKSEIEKLAGQLEKEKSERRGLELQVLRMKVGIAKDIPAELIERLKGETEEEMSADADALLKVLTPEPAGVPGFLCRKG